MDPAKPFTWASGWKSPIYCDNRKTLAFPAIRTTIKEAFVNMIQKQFASVEVIVGVATGAVAQGALVAEALQLPFAYVRSAPKDHGLNNLIEGDIHAGQKAVVIEDLISTGASSLKAVEALRSANVEVLGMVAIFTYGFSKAADSFAAAGCPIYTLTNYMTIIELAIEKSYISSTMLSTLQQWREAPDTWGV